MFLEQQLIALDQFINTFVYAKYEGFGWADETISARCHRLRNKDKWNTARKIINAIFFWEEDHCLASFVAECERVQLPNGYCDDYYQ